MSLTELFVPSARRAVASLSAWLDKAAAGEEAPDELMALRLADDMYPLASQIHFVAYQSQEAIHHLQGNAVPEALTRIRHDGWTANEQPGSFADAKASLDYAAAALAAVEPGSLDAGANRTIALDLPNGMIFDMSGTEFVRDWALPQLYFHLVTAYAILRQHGVPLGKADYVPHMFAYLRPGTMPKG
jgi:hypothetical protein